MIFRANSARLAILSIALMGAHLGCDKAKDSSSAEAPKKETSAKKDSDGDTKKAVASASASKPKGDPRKLLAELMKASADYDKEAQKKSHVALVALGKLAVPTLATEAATVAKDYEKAKGGTGPGQKAEITSRRAKPLIKLAMDMGKAGDPILKAFADNSKGITALEICMGGRKDFCPDM